MPRRPQQEQGLTDGVRVMYPRCAGWDIHQRTVVACRITVGADGQPQHQVRTFGTMTHDLLALSRWLTEGEVTHVAMESTGVYGKPVDHLLEDSFMLLLANAQHIHTVPGRKSDVRDCVWIADLLRHGLIHASFVPDRMQRDLRTLTRDRTGLIAHRVALVNRLHKTLEDANLKLQSVASDLTGVSCRAILAEIIAGATAEDAARLAQLAKGRLRAKLAALEQALTGTVRPIHRFTLAHQLAQLDDCDEEIAAYDAALVRDLAPTSDLVARLDTITGVGRRTAEIIVAEIGTDRSRFPSPDHLTAWAGLAPAQAMSAGKRKPAGTRKGNTSLRAALVEAALAASKTKDTALSARFHRIAARRGKKKAAVAVARHLLVIAYHLIAGGTTYQEHGAHYYDPRDQDRVRDRLIARLQKLGYEVAVTLRPPTPDPSTAPAPHTLAAPSSAA